MLDAAYVKAACGCWMFVVVPACCRRGHWNAARRRSALISPLEAVELARKQVPKGRFERGDAQALPFPAENFDAVLCGYGLMHLPEPAAALCEILRVLRPGGRSALSVWDATGFGLA